MYLHHELREVAPDRQSEALERIGTLHRLMQQSPGFLRSLACRYVGNTTQYAWLRTWVSSADHVAFRQTEPAKAFGRTRPEGLYWPLESGIAPDGHWQSVLESGDPDAAGNHLVRLAFSVSLDSVEAFVKSRSLQHDLALGFPGVVSIVTLEAEAEAEADMRTFLSLVRTKDLEACRAFLESGPATDALDPDSSVGRRLVTECYEIVEELRGS